MKFKFNGIDYASDLCAYGPMEGRVRLDVEGNLRAVYVVKGDVLELSGISHTFDLVGWQNVTRFAGYQIPPFAASALSSDTITEPHKLSKIKLGERVHYFRDLDIDSHAGANAQIVYTIPADGEYSYKMNDETASGFLSAGTKLFDPEFVVRLGE